MVTKKASVVVTDVTDTALTLVIIIVHADGLDTRR